MADTLGPDYYGSFDMINSLTIEEMLERIKTMLLSEELLRSFSEKPQASWLILGSATANNLFNIREMAALLRPGKFMNDDVLIVDRNRYPLQKHQEVLADKPEEVKGMIYPKFHLVQGDIRILPLGDESQDAVVSDYTVNFLASQEDVDLMFSEMSRVLRLGGVAFLTCLFESAHPAEQDATEATIERHKTQQRGAVTIYKFPLEFYLKTAKKYGLEVEEHSMKPSGDDICMIFKKRK